MTTKPVEPRNPTPLTYRHQLCRERLEANRKAREAKLERKLRNAKGKA